MTEKIMAKKIYLKINLILEKKQISLYKLSQELGIPKSTFYDQVNSLRKGRMISWKNIFDFQKKLNINFFD